MTPALPATLAAWLHTLDPFALDLGGGWGVRWYGLSYLLGFAIGFALIRRVARVGRSPLPPQRAGDLVVAMAIGGVLGGRLGYVLFYRPELLWTFTDTLPFWSALAINEGGMASHGGFLGAILGCAWYARRHALPLLHGLDLLAFGAPLGLFFGRIANFINGELIGRPADPGFPLAVRFPQEVFDWPAERISALYTALPPRSEAIGGLGGWTLSAVVDAVQRQNQAVIAVLEPMLTPRHPSQLYAAVGEGLIVFAVLAVLWVRPRRPGLIAAGFCFTYGVARIVDELFRMPDAHLLDQEYGIIGVTRGQWLSVLLIALGAVFVVVSLRRRGAQPLGAWRRGPWTPKA